MENVSSRCGKSDNAPRLRFPEFSGEWEEKKLGEIFKKNTEKNTELKITNVICNSAKNGLIPQREYFDKDIANSENINGYYIIQKYDFVYNPRKSTEAPYGPVSVYKYPDKGIVSPLYLCFRATEKINSDFYEFYFKSSSWHRYIYLSGDNGARHDRVSMRDDVFFAMPVNIPSLPEQKKIAAFFTLLDRRIQKQRQLVEFLKTYKRGVFSVLLNSFSKYETLLLENCASIKKGEQLNKTDMIKNGKYYVLNGGVAASGRTDNFNTDKNTISISEGGNSCGFVLFNTEKFWSGGHCYTLQNLKQNINNQYLFHYLKFHEKQIMSLRVGSGLPNIQKSELEKFEVLLPSADIQNKIANIMSNITAYEDAVKKELLNLDKLKLALLQKMFI